MYVGYRLKKSYLKSGKKIHFGHVFQEKFTIYI